MDTKFDYRVCENCGSPTSDVDEWNAMDDKRDKTEESSNNSFYIYCLACDLFEGDEVVFTTNKFRLVKSA
jgi:hypothetical protein